MDFFDVESVEPDYFTSLKLLLENSLESLGMDLTFSSESMEFGKVEVRSIIVELSLS